MSSSQADGHCLYRSLEDQLQLALEQGDTSSSSGVAADPLVASGAMPKFQQLREAAAAHIRAHPDEFLPYILEVSVDCVPMCVCVCMVVCEYVQNVPVHLASRTLPVLNHKRLSQDYQIFHQLIAKPQRFCIACLA
jgi:hypothetical protein